MTLAEWETTVPLPMRRDALWRMEAYRLACFVKDRVRFYEYALGSAREARHRYFGTRRVIGESEALPAIESLDSIVRLLLVVIPQERARNGGPLQ